MKQLQISKDLFLMLLRFHLFNDELYQENIKEELEKKLNTTISRDLYTKYKTASTKEEQEKARIEYLNLKGYHKDFRW